MPRSSDSSTQRSPAHGSSGKDPDLVCPYCLNNAVLVDSEIIYGGRSYGPAWVCVSFPICDSYVGCHLGTNTPLGRMANKALRSLKSQVHDLFDPMWIKKAQRQRCSKKQARGAGYGWLAKQLGIDRKVCHIGMFDEETCQRAIDILRTVAIRADDRGKRSCIPE